MFGRLLAAFLMVALVTSGLVAQPGTKAEPGGIVGKVVSVDTTKGSVTISVDGKNQTFSVTNDTGIVGPRDGVSKERLKDDRFARGSEITLYPSKDPKVASKIVLGFRPRETTKDTPTKDAPTKDAPAKDKTTPPAKDKDKTSPAKDKTKTPTKDKKDKK